MKRPVLWVAAAAVVVAVGLLAAHAWFPGPAEPGYSVVGEWGGEGDSPGLFDGPIGIAVAGDEVFVSDSGNSRIQVFSSEGKPLARWGGPFAVNLAGRWNAWFRVAVGVGIGADDRVFVADMENNRVQKFTADGRFLVAVEAGFDRPTDVAEAADGSLYVADFGHDRVVRMAQDADQGAKSAKTSQGMGHG